MAATIQTIHKPTRARGLDTSGNNNHAQVYSGRALEFDGVTDYLNTGVTAATLGITNNVTVACWMNSADLAASRNAYIWNFYTSTSDGWGLKFSSSTFKIINDIDNADVNLYATSLNINIWYRVVVVLDNLEQKLYVNGELIGSGTSVADGLDSFTSNLYIGDRKSDGANLFNGMLSDFQVWDSAFSQSDVTYDYLNPEQLALNNGGTSLTNSNLKLWYPMNEGHRGNQSYVLDASNTGLGDDLVNWSSTFNASGTSTDDFGDWTTSANDSTTFCTFDHDNKTIRLRSTDGTHIQAFYSPDILKEGIIYKFEYTISELISGNVRIRPEDNTDYTHHTEAGTYSYLTTPADGNDLDFRIERGTGASDFTVSDVKIYPINDKNNATTLFFGDEQISDSKNRDFGSSSDWGVLNIAGGSLTEPSNKLQVVTSTDNEVEGAALAVGELVTPVAGRTYRISAKLDNTDGATTPTIQFRFAGGTAVNVTASDGSPSDGTIDTTEQEYYADVVAANTSGSLVIQNVASTDSTTFTIDDISVKEVGIASGWTDADQQLDIPQTALQSYNQLAWFDGVADHVSIADHNDFSFGDGSTTDSAFTVSAWIFPNEATKFRIITKQDEWLLTLNGSDKPLFSIYDNSTSHQEQKVAADAVTAGKWYHIVGTYDGTGGTSANTGMELYVNGESVGTNADAGTYAAMHNKSNAVLIGSFGTDSSFAEGCVTECSIWNKELSATKVTELYNSGLALDATTHSDSSNLIGYWRNNGVPTWQDLTANNRDGTPTSVTETMLITAGANSSRDSQGFLMNRQRTTNSLNLDGDFLKNDIADSGAYASVGNQASLDFGTDDFSVAFWFKFNRDDEKLAFVGKQDTNSGWYIYYDASLNGVNFFHRKDSKYTYGSTNPSVDTWYHCCFTRDGAAGKLYLNGSDDTESTQDISASVDSSGDLFEIGRRNLGSTDDRYSDAQIDDLLIYSDKLEAPEVTRIYNAGKRSHK